MGAVAVGVVLVVFLSSLINGLQVGLIDDVVGNIPHVTIEAAVPGAKPLWQVDGAKRQLGMVVTTLEKMSTQKRKVPEWQRLRETIDRLKGVKATAASVEGTGFVGRGAKNVSSVILGIVPTEHAKVASIRNRVIEGHLGKVDQLNAAIGIKMANDLGAHLGSRIRIISDEGAMRTFRVVCIFDMGLQQANSSLVYVGLKAAQALFKIGKDVTTISVRARDMYDADKIADQIRSFCPLTVTSWMETNRAFLDTLRAQNSAAFIIQTITLLASAFGVASVMIVFVVQKSRDIGILKSMGATSRQIRKVFLLEGLGVGLGGALLGSGLGTGLCFMAANVFVPGETFGGRPATIVPMSWDIKYVALASLVAVMVGLASSILPAHRASRLNPVEAIRHG